ncbi:aldo/keto reductase [Gracilibacillus thailandensis]|jgi:methylglyoxal/glyoxal reductase|uniref:Aldo/keto reductase n=1 Tax=Gracilibacillus thailandensis TaxID=563735 RepID=A0A6N7R681_9BACI|nr:aldo/keto reductase [Gracilibacillus thailandensis]MRI68674.1 aldo/keto reductase [Gracilibacillus thailandensis]
MSLTTTLKLNNGTEIPAVGLGVYKAEPGNEVYHAVKSALELGYRHIDTASLYANEEGVGQAIKDSGIPREEIFVTTKVWNDEQGYEETKAAFKRSLERLQMDYVDLYLVHWPVPGKFTETYKALEEIYHDGKAKAIGVSNFEPHHLEELLKEANVTPVVNQVELHPQLQQQAVRDFCAKHDIKVEAWAPLGKARYFDHPVLQELAAKHNKKPSQIIVRWQYQSGIITIPKSVHKERQQENVDIFDFELSNEDIDKIKTMDANNRIGAHPDEFDYGI